MPGGFKLTLGDFLDKRWGDLIAIIMMTFGVILVLKGRSDVGNPLLLSGAVILRPTSKNGTHTQTEEKKA